MRNYLKLLTVLLSAVALGLWVPPAAQGADLFAVSRTSSGVGGQVKRFNGTTGALISTFVSAGSGGLQDPLDLDFGPDGNLYVSDRLSGSIKRYSGSTGAYIDDFICGIGNGGPNGVQFGPDGNLYVQPYNADYVEKYNGITGVYMGNVVSGLSALRDFTWTPADDLLCISSSANALYRYKLDGTRTGTYPLIGIASSVRFAVAAAASGDIYVGVQNLNSIEHYSSTGTYLGMLVSPGVSGLASPARVRIGPDGNLYVSSSAMTSIKKYNISTGAYIGNFASGFTSGVGAWGFRWQTPITLRPAIVGTVVLLDYTGPGDLGKTKAELISSGVVVDTQWLNEGNGVFEFSSVDRGVQYQVRLSACKWVPKTLSVTASQTGTTDMGIISLINGDMDGDGEVGSNDLSIVLKNKTAQ